MSMVVDLREAKGLLFQALLGPAKLEIAQVFG